MAQRALFRPGTWKQNLLTALAVCSVIVVVGCGGGGGGGGTPPPGGTGACGSPGGSTTPVLCGKVFRDGTGTTISGATVTLRSATGTLLSSTTTDTNGFFKFSTVPAGTALFQVDPPATGYTANTARYGGSVYAYYLRNQANTAACIMSTGSIPAGDKDLGSVFLFPDSAPPPPPFGCPL